MVPKLVKRIKNNTMKYYFEQEDQQHQTVYESDAAVCSLIVYYCTQQGDDTSLEL